MDPKSFILEAERIGAPAAYGKATNQAWGDGLAAIPEHMQQSVAMYVLFGTPVGSFLSSVFSNDLSEAVRRADDTNKRELWKYIAFLDATTDGDCYGSRTSYEDWLEAGGLLEWSPA